MQFPGVGVVFRANAFSFTAVEPEACRLIGRGFSGLAVEMHARGFDTHQAAARRLFGGLIRRHAHGDLNIPGGIKVAAFLVELGAGALHKIVLLGVFVVEMQLHAGQLHFPLNLSEILRLDGDPILTVARVLVGPIGGCPFGSLR